MAIARVCEICSHPTITLPIGGGKDSPDYPWAQPREEKDWYCKYTEVFNNEALERQESGEVRTGD